MKKVASLKINALLNMSRQCCSILFQLIMFPYVSRVLGNESYGKYNFSNSIVNYFVLIAALGISTYSIREASSIKNNKEELQQFSNQVFTINIITTLFSYILLFILLLLWKENSDYLILILIQSSAILFTTLGKDWVNVIFEDYVYITIREVIMQLIAVILVLIFVKTSDDYLLYSIIIVGTNIISNISNYFFTKKYINIKLTTKLNIKKHIIPIFILFCNSIAVTIYINSDITLLGIMKGDSEVGIYSFTTKIYNVVKQILNSILIVVIPRVASTLGNGDRKKYNNLLEKVFYSMILIVLPAIVGLFMLSNQIILLAGGKEYLAGVNSLKLLCIALFFAVVASFFANCILIVNRKEKYFLKATIIAAVTNLLANFIFIPILGTVGAAMTTVIAEMLVAIIAIYYSKNDYHFNSINKIVMQGVIGSGVIAIICIIVQLFIDSATCVILTSIILSILSYLIILIFLKNTIALELLNSIKVRTMNSKGCVVNHKNI